MLVLERGLGDRIVIGDEIIVEVVDIRRGKVRLGITADPEIPIHREEVYNRILDGEPVRRQRRKKR